MKAQHTPKGMDRFMFITGAHTHFQMEIEYTEQFILFISDLFKSAFNCSEIYNVA
jgi:hypothetical protein